MSASGDNSLPNVSSPVSLRKNFVWTFAGNLVNAGSQWALIVILAKRTSPEAVGQFAYALAVTTPIMLFASLKLRSAQATDQRHEYLFVEYWSLRLLTTIMALAVILVFGLANRSSHGMGWVIVLVGVAKGVESLSDIFYGLFQKQERMDLIAHSMILRGLVTVAIAIVVLSFTDRVVAVAACLLFSWTVVLLTFDIPKARRLLGDSFGLFPIWSNSRLSQLVVLTLPLGASIAVGSLYNNIPRYVIEHRLGVHDLGIFSALAYFMLFGGMIFTALAQSVIPRMARYHAQGEKKGFRNIFTKLISAGFALGLLGVVVAILAGDRIIALIYDEQYAIHSRLLVLLMIAGFIDMTFLGIASAVNAMRFFRIQFFVSIISVLVVTISSMTLVNSFGINGVAIAMAVTKTTEAIIYMIILRKLSYRFYEFAR